MRQTPHPPSNHPHYPSPFTPPHHPPPTSRQSRESAIERSNLERTAGTVDLRHGDIATAAGPWRQAEPQRHYSKQGPVEISQCRCKLFTLRGSTDLTRSTKRRKEGRSQDSSGKGKERREKETEGKDAQAMGREGERKRTRCKGSLSPLVATRIPQNQKQRNNYIKYPSSIFKQKMNI